ncbi:unnamed protein product [Porites evermanni]|uniref:G-protein coupled receptors family 1 profile domain-containing protein n=1 Tax=Porites evermanni TaxID=104178 RepID=A0ABN8LNN7_9CNID|nr:unnamed protein product [Porites evermanni]
MPQGEAERFRNENKALKTTVYVVCALMLRFLPMALRLVIHLMKRPEIISSLWVRTFAMLNSLLNPLIYCCRQEEIRNFVFKTRTQASHISSFNPSRLLMANITSFDSTNITSKHEDTTEGGSLKNDHYEVDVATLIINSIACPFTVLLNVLVIMAVKRRRRLQTKSNILLACLAATDALTGVITQPAFILWKTFEITGALNYNPARVIHGSALRALSVCSCLHLTLVTAERLVAIKFTMNYLYIVSEEKLR